MASEIGLSESAVHHELAADKDFSHGGMVAVATDSGFEIDARAIFGGRSCTGVDLETE
jgi:hypothetical protein